MILKTPFAPLPNCAARYSLLYLLLTFASAATAAPQLSAEKDLRRCLDKLTALDSRFQQTVSDEFGEQIHRQKGRIESLRPGKLRLEIRQPEPELIIISGNSMQYYQPELDQMTIYPLDRHNPLMLALNGDLGTLLRDYRLSAELRSRSWRYHFNRDPDISNSGDAPVDLTLAFDKCRLQQLEWTDPLGQHTSMSLQRSRGTPKASRFEFTPPNGTTIVRADR